MADGKQRAESDIDLMVIGAITLVALLPGIRKHQAELGREINPTIYTVAEFKRKFAMKDHFLRRVMEKKKIMLVGDADDLKGLVGKPVVAGT